MNRLAVKMSGVLKKYREFQEERREKFEREVRNKITEGREALTEEKISERIQSAKLEATWFRKKILALVAISVVMGLFIWYLAETEQFLPVVAIIVFMYGANMRKSFKR